VAYVVQRSKGDKVSEYPKHEKKSRAAKGSGKQPGAKVPEGNTVVVTGPPIDSPALQHEINHVAGLAGVETSLARLAGILSTYVTQARNGDNGHSLFTDPQGYPVRVVLETDTGDIDVSISFGDELQAAMNSIADSLKQIAARA
jgi:hypothetical protein